jgi:hypothetical protein
LAGGVTDIDHPVVELPGGKFLVTWIQLLDPTGNQAEVDGEIVNPDGSIAVQFDSVLKNDIGTLGGPGYALDTVPLYSTETVLALRERLRTKSRRKPISLKGNSKNCHPRGGRDALMPALRAHDIVREAPKLGSRLRRLLSGGS